MDWSPVEGAVELVDFPATVEAIAGVHMPEVQFGRSLLPALAAPCVIHREDVLCEGGKLKEKREAIPGEMTGGNRFPTAPTIPGRSWSSP